MKPKQFFKIIKQAFFNTSREGFVGIGKTAGSLREMKKGGKKMTNYYVTSEVYEELEKKDAEIIKRLNSGKISIDEAEAELEKIWNVKRIKKS